VALVLVILEQKKLAVMAFNFIYQVFKCNFVWVGLFEAEFSAEHKVVIFFSNCFAWNSCLELDCKFGLFFPF